MSTRTPGPPGTLNAWIMPGDGANVSGSSALIRHSIAWPVNVTSPCLNDSRSPAAMRICSLTMSMPVTDFGDRVLDLDARVHFEEVEVALVVQQELERAGVGVLHGARGVDDRGARACAASSR